METRYTSKKKGYINWWENICDTLSRTTMKLKWRKENNI